MVGLAYQARLTLYPTLSKLGDHSPLRTGSGEVVEGCGISLTNCNLVPLTFPSLCVHLLAPTKAPSACDWDVGL